MSQDDADESTQAGPRGKEGGFAANSELARQAGRKGGEIVRERYGTTFYQEIGRKGGEVVKRSRGTEYYAEIGRKGGEHRSNAQDEAPHSPGEKEGQPLIRKRGRPKKAT
jgi:general stress protein YciG